ncbi:MAG TPA: hypothetical protein VL346_12405 [Acidobacteriaceae bacterium]|nr:hypothetical protein [Acidobacteriaceae bacterium]
MGTSAILPVSAVSAPVPVDYNSASATTAQQAVFNSVLSQLQQSVSAGDLPSSQTLLNAVEAISPSASSGTTPLATFLASLTTALGNNSISAAQTALTNYQQATAAASSGSTPPVPLIPTANTNAEAAQIAASIIKSENQLLLSDSLLNPNNSLGSLSGSSSSSGSSSTNSLIGILNAAYPTSSASSSAGASTSAAPAPSSTPYDTLVSSIQAHLAAGDGTLTPALAYLQAAGNFVNTSA